MTCNEKYNVLVIGAGNIGALFDMPNNEAVLTHGHAFSSHPSFHLIGFVDQDPGRANNAAALWGGKGYTSIESLVSEKLDVICVAVPDEYHYDLLKAVAHMGPLLVFAEKPLTKSMDEAEEIRVIYQKNRIPVCVNFSRRFVPEIRSIKDKIERGEFGKFICGTGYYGKGITHNGSHLADFLRFLIGEFELVNITGTVFDFYDDDPSVSAVIRFAEGQPFYMHAIDSVHFTIFEVDLIFENKRLRFEESGLRIQEYTLKDNSDFKGYRNMVASMTYFTSLNRALYHAADNIAAYLDGRSPLFTSIEDGYLAMKFCTGLK